MCHWKILRDAGTEPTNPEIAALTFTVAEVLTAAVAIHIRLEVAIGIYGNDALAGASTSMKVNDDTITDAVASAIGDLASIRLHPAFGHPVLNLGSDEYPHPAGVAIGLAIYEVMSHTFACAIEDAAARATADTVLNVDPSTSSRIINDIIAIKVIDLVADSIVDGLVGAVENAIYGFIVDSGTQASHY